MKPAAFDYLAPSTIGDALAAKARGGEEAKFLAGGQSLVPAMNFRLAQPSLLVDINNIAGLEGIEQLGAELHLGALVRHRTLLSDARIATSQPLVREAALQVAHPQVRNRGTLCGNLAHADPASELPAVMLALGARMRACSTRGERWIAAGDFFLGMFATALEPDELLAGVALPAMAPRTGAAFLEVSRRQGDFAMMGVAAVLTLDAGGRCASARIALCNAGPAPVLSAAASAAVQGSALAKSDLDAAAAAVQADIDPLGSVHAGKAFQRHLAGVLVRRALAVAMERAAAWRAAAERA